MLLKHDDNASTAKHHITQIPATKFVFSELGCVFHQEPKICKSVLYVVTGAKFVAAGAMKIVGKFGL
jgi:hypothetical protein